MLKTSLRASVLILSLVTCGVHVQGAQELPPVVNKARVAPTLDGRIDENEWKEALYLGVLPGDLPQTEAWITLSDTHYYIAIRAHEPTPDQMRAVTLGDEIKGKVWTDDSIEIFLDPQNQSKSIYRLVANSEGTIFDSQIVNLQQVVEGWTSSAVAKARVGKGGWEIEVAIPMATMGHRLVRGEIFALNIGRNRFAGGSLETASYAGPRYVYPQQFPRVLVEGPIEGDGFSLVSVKRGPFMEKSGGGEWEFQILSGDVNASMFHFPHEKGTSKPRVGKRFVTIPILAGREEAMRECHITQNGSIIFSSSFAVQQEIKATRVTPTSKPIFEPLIEPMPEGLAKRGIINWAHEIFRPSMRVLPLRTGMAYSHETTPYEHYRRDRTSLISTHAVLQNQPELVEQAKKHGLDWTIFLKGKRPDEVPVFDKPGAKNKKGSVWTLDPRMVEAYLQNARETLKLAREEKNVKWIFAGDEVWELLHVALLRAVDEKERYPELQAVDAEIRKNYGFGKFGLPESSNDTNPFRWIATYRWEIDQMMKMAKAVRAYIDEEAPEVGFVSWDCMTGHRPYAIGRWGEVFDIITAQIYPAQGNGRDHAGFTTRFYADLTGKEVWPVPHIGHFPASFTAEEVEEILSATFRGGATGLHLYAADFHNESVRRSGSSVVDRIGAPERWNVARSVIDRLPFRVKQPEADTAIFYSNTSYQGTGAPKTFSLNNQCEWIYTVLGPKLGGALRFVDDLSVPARPESLQKFKAVYIPYMPIADDAEYNALEAYALAGGTVIVCDPLSFRHRSDGSERASGALVPPLSHGSSPGSALPGTPISVEGAGEKLPSLGDYHPLAETGGKVLARYENGQAAVLEVPCGKGRVVFFAGTPLTTGLAANPAWVGFFGTLQEASGAKGGHDVWRFRFPTTPQPTANRPEGVCLTGNYFEWSLSEPKPMLNAQVGGSYVVHGARTPSAEPAGKEVPFGSASKGRLTDRIAGASAPNEAKGDDFVLTCRSETEPWTVTFTFHSPVSPRTARLFFVGSLPEGSCEISHDGENWSSAAQWKARTAQGRGEVALEELALNDAESTRFIRLNFAPTGEKRCGLVEVDFWGEER